VRVALQIEGMTGLVMHNVRLADKLDEYARAIAEINAKSKKTESDYAEIARLEWYGGLYHDPEIGVYLPTWNVIRCLERGGTIIKKGSAVIQALAVTSDKVAIKYDGPRDLAALWERPEFCFRATVGVQRNKVTRMRPIFRKWSLELDAELMDDVLNPSDFDRLAELAGRTAGLGDARKLGYGRFMVEVKRGNGH
jgi:hypothetical protein